MDFNTSVASPSPVALDIKPPQSESPLQMLAQMQEFKGRQQQMQMQQQQMQTQQLQQQELQLNLAQRKAVNDAYRQAFTPQSDGSMQLDKEKLTNALATAGHGEAIPGIMEGWTKYQQSVANLQETNGKVAAAEQDAAGNLAATVRAANNDPTLFHTLLTDAMNRKVINAGHFAPFDQAIGQAMQQDPTGEQARNLVGKFTDQMIAGSPKQQELANSKMSAQGAAQRGEAAQTQAGNSTLKTTAELPGINAESDIKAATANALKTMTDADWQRQIDATVTDRNSPLYRRTQAAVSFYRQQGNLKAADDTIKAAGEQLGKTETAVATAKATEPIKIEMSGAMAAARADQAGLTDDDYSRLGVQYARTGVMPAMGRDQITRGKIAHSAEQWARDNGLTAANMTAMQAAYVGDKNSLVKFKAQRDQIVSFEQTAQKNLDLFLDAASKIPDTGSPWLNKPLRSLDANAAGSANMAAVNAARQVANNEIAKVTSGGGLSGVLSDSARREVQDYNPADATFAQTLAVAKVLKADMANRHGAMDATLEDINQRLGGPAGGGTAVAPMPAQLSAADVGKIYRSKTGEMLKITAVNPKDPTQFKSEPVKQ